MRETTTAVSPSESVPGWYLWWSLGDHAPGEAQLAGAREMLTPHVVGSRVTLIKPVCDTAEDRPVSALGGVS